MGCYSSWIYPYRVNKKIQKIKAQPRCAFKISKPFFDIHILTGQVKTVAFPIERQHADLIHQVSACQRLLFSFQVFYFMLIAFFEEVDLKGIVKIMVQNVKSRSHCYQWVNKCHRNPYDERVVFLPQRLA